MYKVLRKDVVNGKAPVSRKSTGLENLLLREFYGHMEKKKDLLFVQRSVNLDEEFDIYYKLGSKFVRRLETILDKRDYSEIISLETNLFEKNDEKSKLLLRTLELYLYTKIR
ncbi:hypothetical protein HDR59_02550 [bacterium]|nr:hypothetical protein [bacterium]